MGREIIGLDKSAVITYHSLDETGSKISISPAVFRRHLDALRASRFQVVPLANIRDKPGSLAITFDDGYRNFLEVALPLLSEYRFPATIFIVSGYCGRQNDWGSRLKNVPRLEIASWAEVHEMARAGVAIGAHTVNHPDLTSLPREQVIRELRDCRLHIEDRIGGQVDALAYPYGAVSEMVCGIAREEFRMACGIRPRFAGPASDPLDLPRIDAGYLRRPFWMDTLDTPLGTAYLAAQRVWKA